LMGLSLALAASVVLTWCILVLCRRFGKYDHPNSRSSHSVPTPRGGGAGFVIVFLCAVLLLAGGHAVPGNTALALIGGGGSIALLGALDDQFHLSPWVRLPFQFAAAIWGAFWIGVPAILQGSRQGILIRFLLEITVVLALVWLINLYNFMDGIDGLAGAEAVSVSGFGGVLMVSCGMLPFARCAFLLTAATAGFLFWNWPPARIFMGDVGSGFLGFVLGILTLSSINARSSLFWSWFILLSVFTVDSTLTLARRMVAGARWYEAHCTHAYQHAAKRWRSHLKVTTTILGINVLWLFPLAAAACAFPNLGTICAMIALVPLVGIALRFDAGRDGFRTQE